MLRRYTWEKAKDKLQHYRRRSPETSPLSQIVYHSRDDLKFQWEARFEHQYGCLRDEVLKTFDEYLNLVSPQACRRRMRDLRSRCRAGIL